MAEIIIVVGEHPAEATAMPIGRAVFKKLKTEGHQVRYIRIHGPLPKGGTIVGYRRMDEPAYRGKFDFRDAHRSAQVVKIARDNPDSFVFSFHNFAIPDYWSKTAKSRNEHVQGARQSYGGMFDPATRSIIFQTSEHPKAITKRINLFTVETPTISTENRKLDFPISNHKLSKQFGYVGEHMANGITRKISNIVNGKRMSVMKPRTRPREIKRRRISIR